MERSSDPLGRQAGEVEPFRLLAALDAATDKAQFEAALADEFRAWLAATHPDLVDRLLAALEIVRATEDRAVIRSAVMSVADRLADREVAAALAGAADRCCPPIAERLRRLREAGDMRPWTLSSGGATVADDPGAPFVEYLAPAGEYRIVVLLDAAPLGDGSRSQGRIRVADVFGETAIGPCALAWSRYALLLSRIGNAKSIADLAGPARPDLASKLRADLRRIAPEILDADGELRGGVVVVRGA